MTPVLRLSNAHKSYGGIHALRGAEFALDRPGEVRTLIGENGSGKSTLLGILSGQLRPDAGVLEVGGSRVDFHSPQDALRAGIAMVSQETSIAPNLTVGENVLLGRVPRSRLAVDRRRMHARATEVLGSLGLDYDTHAVVGDMRPDQRQMVEIARAVSMQARVLILDEPTSSLTDNEVEGLFAAIDQMRGQGVAVVFVSHRLREAFRISDAITVLRDGRTVAAAAASEFTTESLVGAMIGSSGALDRAVVPAADRSAGEAALLTLQGLTVPGGVTDLDLQLRPGEVLGLAGLEGCGRSTVLEAVFGLHRCAPDAMRLGGAAYAPHAPRDAIDAGVAYLPPDRKLSGLVLVMTVGENLAMAVDARRFALATPSSRSKASAFATAKARIRLKAASSRVGVGTLSGGNQQKVALGKWLATDARLLLLDEPTRGVDVAAKADIHASIREFAATGAAVLVSSSENPELLAVCDRIAVLFAGQLVAVVDATAISEAALARLAGGHTAIDPDPAEIAGTTPADTPTPDRGQR